MGTLVKEDFGRPDRANTMVRICFLSILCSAAIAHVSAGHYSKI